MDNLKELPHVMHSYFILHNFFKLKKETGNLQLVEVALKYDKGFVGNKVKGQISKRVFQESKARQNF